MAVCTIANSADEQRVLAPGVALAIAFSFHCVTTSAHAIAGASRRVTVETAARMFILSPSVIVTSCSLEALRLKHYRVRRAGVPCALEQRFGYCPHRTMCAEVDGPERAARARTLPRFPR
jgi:hypothetical protein